MASRISSGKTPLGGSETYVDEGVMFLRSQNVYDDGLRLDDVVFISEGTDESMAVSRVIPRDILLNITGASIGRSCLVPEGFPTANVNQHVCAIRLRDESQSPIFAWLFKSSLVKNQIDLAQNGAAREGLNFEQIGGMTIVVPPPDEQSVIATFLDHETAKIDALVAEQQVLIGLLKEKRQAVISHAVTKGLDPSVPMKDSGVEWLGEVPGHWEVTRLRHVATLNPSKSEAAALGRDTEVSFLPMDAIGDDGSLTLDRTRPISEVESGYTYFREGDVTVAKITPCFENGKGAVMRSLHNGHGFGTTELIVARPLLSKTSSDYLHRLFTSQAFRQLGEAAMYGAGGQKRVPDDFVRDFVTALPPPDEQSAIATFLDRETAQLHALTAEAQSAITLLQERRSALISAAVTGQIDVRQALPA